MPSNILRRDRINTGRNEETRKLSIAIDSRISERIESVLSTTAPIIYGYAGVPLIPIFRAARNSQRILTDVSVANYQGNDPDGINKGLFGNWFGSSQSGTQQLLMQQYILCAGSIRNPLSIFINEESIRLDGWAAVSSITNNKWRNSAHHWNVPSLPGDAAISATKLANVYFPSEKTLSDTAEGLTLVTGLYERRSYFGGNFPEVFAIVIGQWPAKRITSAGKLQKYTDGNAGNFGLYSSLLDWLTSSDYGPGMVADDFDAESWSRTTTGGIALTQNAAAVALTIRIRKPAYEADTRSPKRDYSEIGSPIPAIAEWPIWGSIDTGKSFNEILREFTLAVPGLLLWWDLNGKLSADVTDLIRLSNPTADVLITDNDLINLPSVDVPSINHSHGNVGVKFRDYEEDFRETIYDSTTVLASVERIVPGTYSFTVPSGVTRLKVTVVGGGGGHGDYTMTASGEKITRPGLAGGMGRSPGTTGGDGGFGDARRGQAQAGPGEGGANRTGTGISGNELNNGGSLNCSDMSGSRWVCTDASPGTWVDISDSNLTKSQINARRGCGGGGGAGWCADRSATHGGAGGGGGGSSAITRGNSVLIEGYGGRGGGGAEGIRFYDRRRRIGYPGESAIDTSSTLIVIPGEVLTIYVGQGGLGGITDRVNLQSAMRADNGRVSIVSVNEAVDIKNKRTTIVRSDLCGSKQHAMKISKEVALRSQLHRVSARLVRKFIGIEPGDIVKINTAFYKASIIVTDRGIEPDLTVNIVGLNLLTNVRNP